MPSSAVTSRRSRHGQLASRGPPHLYTGPFLDGFFLPYSTEFEHWVQGANSLGQSLNLRVRRRVKLLLQDRGMHMRLPQGSPTVTGCLQGSHQGYRHLGAVGIRDIQPTPPFHCARMISPCLRRACKSTQRLAIRQAESAPQHDFAEPGPAKADAS